MIRFALRTSVEMGLDHLFGALAQDGQKNHNFLGGAQSHNPLGGGAAL